MLSHAARHTTLDMFSGLFPGLYPRDTGAASREHAGSCSIPRGLLLRIPPTTVYRGPGGCQARSSGGDGEGWAALTSVIQSECGFRE